MLTSSSSSSSSSSSAADGAVSLADTSSSSSNAGRQLQQLPPAIGADVSDAPSGSSSSSSRNAGRQLQQSAFCPEGCAPGFCVQDATVGGLRCTKCLNNLRVNLINGRCGEFGLQLKGGGGVWGRGGCWMGGGRVGA